MASTPTAVASLGSEQPGSSGRTAGPWGWGPGGLLVQRRRWGSERCPDQGPLGTAVRDGGGSFTPRQEDARGAVSLFTVLVSLRSSHASWGLSQLWPPKGGSPGLVV